MPVALKSNLDPNEEQMIKKETSKLLSISRHTLLRKYPFIGSICLRMDIVPVRDIRVKTMCTDGRRIFADCEFTQSLNDNERLFVLGHEVWHCVLMHLTRRQARDPNLFNIATDKEVNYMLKNDNFVAPPNLCWPNKNEEGLTAEEIYELMKKDLKTNQTLDSSSKDMNQPGNNIDKKLVGQFDSHTYKDDKSLLEKEFKELATDKWGDVGFDEDFNPQVPENFSDRMREIVVSEAQRIERQKGSLPNHIKKLVNTLLTPELQWQELLSRFVTKCYANSSRTWLPPNRRYVHKKLYLQSRRSESIKVAVAIDTSGSCQEDLSKFLTELNSLVKSFGSYEIHLIQCDAKVDKYDVYDEYNPLDVESYGFTFSGGGGTSFIPPFEYVVEQCIDANAFIYFTDGYGPAPDKNPLNIPVLWILTPNCCDDFCDWGEKIKLKQN